MQCCWWQKGVWECVNSNLSQTSQAGGTKGDKAECGSAGEKGRDSPLSRAITLCTAQVFQKRVAVRVSPPARAALPADLRDLPGVVAVSCFSASSHLSVQTPSAVWCGGTPRDWLCCPLGEAVAISTRCLQMNHDLLTTWLVLQGPKTTLIRAVTPSQPSLLTEQVLLHTLGRICKSSFCRAQWQILFSGYFCRWVFGKPTCYKVGSIHQPVKNSWCAWSGVLSPCWQEIRVLGSWDWFLWEPGYWGWHSLSCFIPARWCPLPTPPLSSASSGPG